MSTTARLHSVEMGAAPFAGRAALLDVPTRLGPISLYLTGDLRGLEARWSALQDIVPCTAAQTYSYAEAWARLVLAPQGGTPLIAIGVDAQGRDLFLWAFEIESACGLKVMKWLGESHASYAMGLFRPELAPRFGARDLQSLLAAVARFAGASAAFLCAQPYEWDGIVNPFATLRHQSAPSNGYAVRVGNFTEIYHRCFSKSSRAKAQRKERRLREAGPLVFGWAATEAERLALLDTLFAQKARQLAELGVKNPFDAEVRSFYREMALLAEDDPARLRLGYLTVNGEVAATHSGTLCHDRLSICLSSLTAGEVQRLSPGALLLRHQIEEACEQGVAYYDLGAGAGPNKDEWCDMVQPCFDNFVAFGPLGLLATLPAAASASVKRAIKSNRHLWPLLQRWRQALLGKKPPAQPARI
jgi:CelD/BcsL family acetyltransferase involved in cellulose biosynthesis